VRPAAATFGALLVLGLGGGCGGGDDASDPAALESVPWIVSSGLDVDGWEAFAPSIRFEGGRYDGSSGCNRYGGSYTVDGETIELGDTGATLIACPPPAGDVERAYFDALDRVARWSVDDELVLLDVDENEVLRYVAATPEGSWEVTSFATATAVSSPIAGTELTASFEEDGTLSGFAGCNTYMTTYSTDGEAIEIAPAATTRKACPEPDGVMQQEAAYVAALVEAERFSVGGGVLQLLREDGTIVASYGRPE
jgi:heat shock protein HslJ